MNWQTPKTNWEVKPYVNGMYQGDWFNVADYERIVNNIRYLHAVGQNVYSVIFDLVSMITITQSSYPTADILNALEDNIYALTHNLYSPPAYTGKKTWAANGNTPDFSDLNRFEQTIASIYEDMMSQVYYVPFVPAGSNSFVTSDGLIFRVFELI